MHGHPWRTEAGRAKTCTMDPLPPVLAFTLAATLLTLTPGADTALVLRTAAREGAPPGMAAGLGVVVGVMA